MKDVLIVCEDIKLNLTYIKTTERELYLPTHANKLIETWCLNHGRSIIGAKKSALFWLGNIKNVPLYISNKLCLIMIKTDYDQTKLWLNNCMILKTKRLYDHLTIVYFNDNSNMIIKVNDRVINKQIQRANILLKMID
ncbi:MAG: competence protein ComK [Erysipelotrichaceae bacterium]|nr:competence protein ComK [Erysipelotrichaceae bacterium]